MKNIAVFLNCSGMGDIISSIPTIKFLHKLYKTNILVFTHNTELLKNYTYINAVEINIDEMEKLSENPNYLTLSTFAPEENIHPRMDIRQFHASKLGFQLLPEEMNIEFYPDKYEPIKELPENYIAIHPVKTWPSRTWEQSRWQEFINIMNSNNIPVVAIGKKSQEIGTYNTQKPTFNVEIENGLNLLNKASIHQTWHILNKATAIVTMDSGILHLAGTTDTAIIQLGSSIDPRLRSPYRNDRQDYKYSYIPGECKLLCASDLKYNIKYNNQFNIIAPITFCLELPETFGDQTLNSEIYRCHPSVKNVVDETIRVFELYKNKEIVKYKISVSNKGEIIL